MPPVAVVVPTYRRPAHLLACLDALEAQSRSPDEIIVVRRACDNETTEALSRRASRRRSIDRVKEVTVDEPGQLSALARGVEATTAPLIGIMDDDAFAREDWLERSLEHFKSGDVGIVGGRDAITRSLPGDRRPTADVGRISRWGKLYGNQSRGTGCARDVMVLQMVAVYRREALAFPRGLRGDGAQVHAEVAMSLWAQDQGWKLIYDPRIVVDHDLAPRFDRDARETPAPAATRDAAYNYVLCLLTMRPNLFWRRAAYGLLIGDRAIPGVARAGYGLLAGETRMARHLGSSLLGQMEALSSLKRGRRVSMVTLVGRGEASDSDLATRAPVG